MVEQGANEMVSPTRWATPPPPAYEPVTVATPFPGRSAVIRELDVLVVPDVQVMWVGLTLPPVAFHLMSALTAGSGVAAHDRVLATLTAFSLPFLTVTDPLPVVPTEHVSLPTNLHTMPELGVFLIRGANRPLPVTVHCALPNASNRGLAA